ncbi:DUF998 domain-containing protein [Acidiferrimicrobium sp. IK]|uniref:DUF998 domain-containing protein n=1 Tax=Acidiferrimicrobium sp. IK TaxID=2871700 RepID=UPI0021CAFA6A|nr:DUF998 domain-containing protein [Acidiferrimicrobium sp. IK]MCU4187380.1 DUF998 domain-containing protein [Acidiferrimicrobium sp. IK]
MRSTRYLAWGGIAGPVAFTGAWLTAGALRPGYRPVEDTISRLAASGAPNRWLMTAGFVTYGVGLPLYARALRHAAPGPAWLAAIGTGVATLAVAAAPLAVSPALDTLHAVAAGAGYLTLAAVPVLAARPLRRAGLGAAAAVSTAVAAGCALTLVASVGTSATGALQRAGLGAGHAWVAASAWWILAGRSLPEPPPAPTGATGATGA